MCLHTDGLNESTELEGTIDAIGNRTIHAYHVEGAGGGHVPDVLGLVRVPSVLCSSTTPGLPWGRAADAEHTDMILIVHEGNPSIPDDVAGARERVRATTMAAEGPLHDLGAISIVNSDSQGMGRIGETIRRTWQLAHAMKSWRASSLGTGWPEAPVARRARPRPAASLADDGLGPDDNERVLAYLARYTTEPAIVHGAAAEVGSLEPGRLADIVLWEPSKFGVRPFLVIKGGVVAWSAMGEGNASVHGAEPTAYGPDWGATGDAAARLSTTFVSAAAAQAGFGGHAAPGGRGARHPGAHAGRSRREHRGPRDRGLPRRRRGDARRPRAVERAGRRGAAVAPLPAGVALSARTRPAPRPS